VRVIAGRFRGRRLADAPRSGVRPTSDRVRESLFAWLGDIEGASVLDAYAGTGALGIEALSRGARRAVFVERSQPAISVLRRNLRALDLGDSPEVARVLRGDAVPLLRRLGRAGDGPFDLVFLDPPYASGELPRALVALVGAGVVAAGGEVVVEAPWRHPLPAVKGLAAVGQRRYGDTQLGRYTRTREGVGGLAERSRGAPPRGRPDESAAAEPEPERRTRGQRGKGGRREA